MKTLVDYRGLSVRLTDERVQHILEHPEMAGMEKALMDAFVLTAYLTDKPKRGDVLWRKP